MAVLTETSLTGLGMGDIGDDNYRWNEVQTLRLDADAGSFRLEITGDSHAVTGDLAHDISAADLQAALEDLLNAAYDHIDEGTKENVRVTVADDGPGVEFQC